MSCTEADRVRCAPPWWRPSVLQSRSAFPAIGSGPGATAREVEGARNGPRAIIAGFLARILHLFARTACSRLSVAGLPECVAGFSVACGDARRVSAHL